MTATAPIGKMFLIAVRDDGTCISPGRPAGYDLPPGSVAADLSDADSLVCIHETATKVGEYVEKTWLPLSRREFYGAYVYTLKVWVVDVDSSEVIAYRGFEAPPPPRESEATRLPYSDTWFGQQGIVPKEEATTWL
jgi:hypothetical protein